MKDVIVDTNLLLYALDSGNIYHQSVLKLLGDTSLRLFVTTKNISEYFAVCSKLNVPIHEASQFYRQICQNMTMLFPTANSLTLFEGLLQKYQPKGNQVFDLEIVSIAIACQVMNIATLNERDFAIFTEINLHPIQISHLKQKSK